MKKNLAFAACLLLSAITDAQNVGISDTESSFTPDNSAALEVKSTSRGVLIPRLTTAQRTTISSPAEGLLVYDSDLDYFYYYIGATWQQLGGTSRGSSEVTDTDGDTKIETEPAADADVIEFYTGGTQRMEIDESGNVKMGGASNYTNIESDGSLRVYGEATTYSQPPNSPTPSA